VASSDSTTIVPAVQACADELRRLLGAERVSVTAPLAPLTTFKVGGAADVLIEAKSETELVAAVAIARAADLPITPLGGGSNVLVGDGGIRGLVVLVIKIAVTGQNGRKKVFTPTEDVVLESVLHEISAHAGRMTEGRPDTHGDRGVDDIAREVGEFFRWSADARGAVPSSTSKEIFEFIDKNATAPK
jgi:hypothetical protein